MDVTVAQAVGRNILRHVSVGRTSHNAAIINAKPSAAVGVDGYRLYVVIDNTVVGGIAGPRLRVRNAKWLRAAVDADPDVVAGRGDGEDVVCARPELALV